jgi:hypothetical protein
MFVNQLFQIPIYSFNLSVSVSNYDRPVCNQTQVSRILITELDSIKKMPQFCQFLNWLIIIKNIQHVHKRRELYRLPPFLGGVGAYSIKPSAKGHKYPFMRSKTRNSIT